MVLYRSSHKWISTNSVHLLMDNAIAYGLHVGI